MNPSNPLSPGRVLLIVTLLNILNFSDRYMLVSFSVPLMADLQMSNFQFGLLTGFIFVAVYMAAGLVAGPLADRVHRPRLIACGLALWSALTALTGSARSFVQMASARVFIGVGEATLLPAALSMIADVYKPQQRALASGIFYLGIPVGIGGVYIFASIAGPLIGWRGAFWLLGALGIAGAALLWFLRDPPRGGADANEIVGEAPHNLVGSFRAMFDLLRDNKPFFWTCVAGCAVTFVQGSTVLDLQWWVHERGFTEVTAQQYTGLMFLTGGIIGAFAGGIGGDLCRARMLAGQLRFLLWAFIVTIPMTVAYRYLPGGSFSFYLTGFGGCILFMLFYGPIASALQEQVPPQVRAAAIAFSIVIMTLTSAIGAALVGFLADLYTKEGLVQPLTRAIQDCASVGLISIPALFLAAHHQIRLLTPARAENPAGG